MNKKVFSGAILSMVAPKPASSIVSSSFSSSSSSNLLTCARSTSFSSLPSILLREVNASAAASSSKDDGGGGGMSRSSSRVSGGGGVRAFSSLQLISNNSISSNSSSSSNNNDSSNSSNNSYIFVNNRRSINSSYNSHSRNIFSNCGGGSGSSCNQHHLHLATWRAGFSSKSKGKGRWHENSNSNNSSSNSSSNTSNSNNSNSNSNSNSSNNSGSSSLPSHLGTDPSFVPGPIYTEDAEHLYKTEMKQLRKWLNPHIYQNNGRLFDADRGLLEDRYSKIFPAIKAELLETSKESIFPDCFPECDIKLVGISFKGYGQEACKTWMAPFLAAYGGNSRVRVGELFLSEHSILSPLTFMFVNAAKKNIPQERWSTTAVKIGNINEVAVPLLLPNKYSGYMFLLDKKNMIRWRSSGYPTGDEIETFLKLTQILLDKPMK